jgi:hypothetical protein
LAGGSVRQLRGMSGPDRLRQGQRQECLCQGRASAPARGYQGARGSRNSASTGCLLDEAIEIHHRGLGRDSSTTAGQQERNML